VYASVRSSPNVSSSSDGPARLGARVVRAVPLAIAAAWGVGMTCAGLLAAFEWPGRMGDGAVSGWSLVYLGLILIAGGVFVCALVCGRLFPQARRGLVLGAEVLPWVLGLAAAVVWFGGSR
jgi:hypothetical protein